MCDVVLFFVSIIADDGNLDLERDDTQASFSSLGRIFLHSFLFFCLS